MNWNDVGFLVHKSVLGENSAVLTILTQYHGRYRGIMRGAKLYLLLGSQVDTTWNARLEEQLGYFELDQLYMDPALIYHHGALKLLQLMCALCHGILPERFSVPAIFDAFMDALPMLSHPQGLQAYNQFEFTFFNELGYGHENEGHKHCLHEDTQHPLIRTLKKRQNFLEQHWPHLVTLHKARKDLLVDVQEV